MSFSNRFNELIEKSGYSNYKVAHIVGVKEAAVRKWRKGDTIPRDRQMENIASIFNVSSAWLRYGDKAYAPSFKDDVVKISYKIEKYLQRHPEEADRIEEVIDAITREPGEFRQRSTTTGSQTERKEESRTKKSRRKTA